MKNFFQKLFARFRRPKNAGRLPIVYGAQSIRRDLTVAVIAEGDIDTVEGVWLNGERWTRGYVDRQGAHQLSLEDAERLMRRMMIKTSDDQPTEPPPIELGPMTVDKAREIAYRWRDGQLIRHEIDNDPILNATDLTFD